MILVAPDRSWCPKGSNRRRVQQNSKTTPSPRRRRRRSSSPAARTPPGILGREVAEASEQTELFLQLVLLPEGQAVKVLDGHPEDAEELLLGQMSLQAGISELDLDEGTV